MLYLYFLLVLQISSEISGSPPVTKPDGSLDLTSLLSRMSVLEQTVSSSLTQLEIELHSTTNVLQSTRDDLETTKTELQTTRSELQATMTELQNTKSDLAQKTKDVAFHVYSNGGSTGSNITLNFDGVRYNAGNGYDTTTGKFTAPVSGTYILMAQVELYDPPPPSNTYIYIIKSSTAISAGFGTLTSVNQDRTITITAVTDLKQGEQVWVTSRSDVVFYGGSSGYTIFVGALLSAY